VTSFGSLAASPDRHPLVSARHYCRGQRIWAVTSGGDNATVNGPESTQDVEDGRAGQVFSTCVKDPVAQVAHWGRECSYRLDVSLRVADNAAVPVG